MTRRLDVRGRVGPVLAVLLGLAPWPLLAQPVDWSGRAGLTSEWRLRGVRLSDGHAPVAYAAADAYAGAWGAGASAMRLRAQDGRWTEAWSLHAGAEWHAGPGLALVADLQHLHYGRPLQAWNGQQLTLGLQWGDLAAVYWNRQRLREPALDADSLDAALHWPLAPGWRLTGGAGYAWHALGAPYVYGQAGFEWHSGAARVQLQRGWTHGAGPPLSGTATAGRWLAGVGVVF